ncbi:unnamed protein product [[Candida] boidinii]|uniref:Unnamed protein product n=1 Tax=Candida boidinii TaxID=5477 RepID=A0A9W6SUP4_CANBO|nr:hypothetical protein B5S30_g5760 [[Candida] boidinii]GME67560.1 unnamed protein product [[Candida] boidinii]
MAATDNTTKNSSVHGASSASFLQYLRLALILITFFTGCLSIVASQFIIIIFFNNDEITKQEMLNFTKKNFVILLTFVTKWVSPTHLVITHDHSIPEHTFQYLTKKTGGEKLLTSNLDNKAIIIANHQIYSDWLFLWWIAYLNNCADNFYIIMKDSLEKIPVLGYGMRNYSFIFLSRKWENDKNIITKQLNKINENNLNKDVKEDLKKNWLLIFPEGTNMSDNRKEVSDNFIKKNSYKSLNQILLPRVRGLFFSICTLSKTSNFVYDFTIGYSGHKNYEFAQDIFTLNNIYLFGKGPKEVHMHIRAFDIKKIPGIVPIDSESITEDELNSKMDLFQEWLFERWQEKDQLLIDFYKNSKFINNKVDKITNKYESELKLNSIFEIIAVYCIPIFVIIIFYLTFLFAKSRLKI